ncbi:MAG: hypothetical protein L0H26_10950, partial [Microlunatus sp.]|nr:hypothetical protein [Microlunatus sp.]
DLSRRGGRRDPAGGLGTTIRASAGSGVPARPIHVPSTHPQDPADHERSLVTYAHAVGMGWLSTHPPAQQRDGLLVVVRLASDCRARVAGQPRSPVAMCHVERMTEQTE